MTLGRNYQMEIKYQANDGVTPEEMQSLEESVGFGPHRNLQRNEIALAGSIFIATARCEGRLIGLVRLVGDGAYILRVIPTFCDCRASDLVNSSIC